jgi:hypothetical protein
LLKRQYCYSPFWEFEWAFPLTPTIDYYSNWKYCVDLRKKFPVWSASGAICPVRAHDQAERLPASDKKKGKLNFVRFSKLLSTLTNASTRCSVGAHRLNPALFCSQTTIVPWLHLTFTSDLCGFNWTIHSVGEKNVFSQNQINGNIILNVSQFPVSKY